MFGTLFFLFGALAGALVAGVVALGIHKTLSARIRSAERRARSVERLAELGAMTGGLAHEIKNPLSTIGLNAQLLGEGIEELPVHEEEKGRLVRRVQSLRREVERLRGILTDFLQFAGEMRLDCKAADLHLAIEELIDFFLPQAEKAGIRLRADHPPGQLMVEMDIAHIKQALLNLLLNATQAMAGDTSSQRPRELIVRAFPTREPDRSEAVQIHVIDTGPGIDEQTQAKIFRPYFTTKSGGTGLGLPTARRIIEAHGGRIDVHSETGRGTDFVITLPLKQAGREEPGR
ncbi:MAG: ATP-binding protein [Phycisphaerales bacterium]|nr:two-component sensor histidine kinase [Planctomycetota bacterium]